MQNQNIVLICEIVLANIVPTMAIYIFKQPKLQQYHDVKVNVYFRSYKTNSYFLLCVLFILGTVSNELAKELVLICFPDAQTVLACACYHP